MKWYLKVLQEYANFSGRAGREEYWMFFLFNTLAAIAIGIAAAVIQMVAGVDANYIAVIYQLGIFIPSIAVAVRRMHDTDHSGWWIIVPIVGFVFLFFKGHPDQNRFGAAP